ncbi:hypothetical protein [Winogradskyella poriferorum]|uniref:hypothetical protein n=1 Tax=Winogradskyella poriferorum TaxID=307627 RepID=UPI003D651AFB
MKILKIIRILVGKLNQIQKLLIALFVSAVLYLIFYPYAYDKGVVHGKFTSSGHTMSWEILGYEPFNFAKTGGIWSIYLVIVGVLLLVLYSKPKIKP